jgi:hypothetical protein
LKWIALGYHLEKSQQRPMLTAMHQTQCPSCGAIAQGVNRGGDVAYHCRTDGEFRVSARAATQWAQSDRAERQRVLAIARKSGDPPLVRREHFDMV